MSKIKTFADLQQLIQTAQDNNSLTTLSDESPAIEVSIFYAGTLPKIAAKDRRMLLRNKFYTHLSTPKIELDENTISESGQIVMAIG